LKESEEELGEALSGSPFSVERPKHVVLNGDVVGWHAYASSYAVI
jgi:hypothetical protein